MRVFASPHAHAAAAPRSSSTHGPCRFAPMLLAGAAPRTAALGSRTGMVCRSPAHSLVAKPPPVNPRQRDAGREPSSLSMSGPAPNRRMEAAGAPRSKAVRPTAAQAGPAHQSSQPVSQCRRDGWARPACCHARHPCSAAAPPSLGTLTRSIRVRLPHAPAGPGPARPPSLPARCPWPCPAWAGAPAGRHTSLVRRRSWAD